MVSLPKRRQEPPKRRKVEVQVVQDTVEVASVTGGLGDLGTVDLVVVSGGDARASWTWKSLMQTYHYLGAGPLCGAQLRYLVRSSVHGWLGGLSFSSAVPRLKARDAYIGWTEELRHANREKVIQNSRFLVAPTVKVPNLASHVLGKAVARVGQDWVERYGYEPALVETFVDERQFTGACYQAANWVHVGYSAGRQDGFANGKVSSGRKGLYLYPLHDKWREALHERPERAMQVGHWAEEATDWAEAEFGGARLYDGRLRRRLYELGRDFFAKPGVLIPEVCDGSTAKMKAAYRFMSNARLDLQGILRGHIETTAARMRQHKVVLAVQDTTSLNYSTHHATEGLGPINTKKTKAKGLFLHDTLAFDSQGTPLGLLDVQCWARDPALAGKSRDRATLPIEEKESVKWLRSYEAVAEIQRACPETLVVSVGDREADIHELFEKAQDAEGRPALLVRAERSRKRRVVDGEEGYESLWAQMAGRQVSGHQVVNVPKRQERDARIARLEVRHGRVTLSAPHRNGKQTGLMPIEMWSVYAVEVGHGPEVRSPLEWMLLTTVPTETFDDAVERLRWYKIRWSIEVYHRTLKSGCRIEDRRLDDAHTLQTCLAIDLVVAWRVFFLVKQGRETPDVPCDVFLAEHEWKALYTISHRKLPPKQPMSLREAVRLIAKLGGFLGRKRDGEPGATTLWRGLGRLSGMSSMYAVLQELNRERDGP